MATSSTGEGVLSARGSAWEAVTAAAKARPGVPWYIWCAVLGVTSAVIGAHWDISWHKSIGRDTFWTPAHIAIYLCGVLAGVAFGYVILSTTLSKSAPLANASVHIWGFRAPLGAFIASWGGIAMLTSAPFDNWWHDAYGLDVKIVSPPHILLFIGVYGVFVGTQVLIASHMNRVDEQSGRVSRWLFLYITSMMLITAMIVLMEYTGRVLLHTSLPYLLVSAILPILLAIGSKATRIPFAATFIAGIYTVFLVGFIIVLPLFPAEPKLGPVYQHVAQFIPPEFPMLIVIPAFVLDLIWRRTKNWNLWRVAVLSAFVFVGLLLVVEWPFAEFLMSAAARNRFFGTMYLSYGVPPTSYIARSEFFPNDGAFVFWRGIAIALILCTLAIRWGFSRGEWFSNIRR
jgi:hypothetical protein